MKKRAPLTGKEVNWNQLFYFCEVAAEGSLKDAGGKLGLSPSTLSEHVAQLEEDLKILLFHRHHRKLELTEEGARLFQQVKPMFEAGLRMLDVMSPLPLGHYPVNVGLVASFSLPLGYEFIQRFLAHYRSGKIHLEHASHEQLEKGLSESSYDFGFSYRPPERKDLQHRLVKSASLGFYVSASTAGERTESLLARMPLLLCGEEESRQNVKTFIEKSDIAPMSLVTSDYPGLILDLCLQGRGVAVLSEGAIQESQRKGLRQLRWPGGHGKLEERLYAIWPIAAERSASVQEFLRLMKE